MAACNYCVMVCLRRLPLPQSPKAGIKFTDQTRTIRVFGLIKYKYIRELNNKQTVKVLYERKRNPTLWQHRA